MLLFNFFRIAPKPFVISVLQNIPKNNIDDFCRRIYFVSPKKYINYPFILYDNFS